MIVVHILGRIGGIETVTLFQGVKGRTKHKIDEIHGQAARATSS
jgi:hypothetical protein